MHPKSAYGLAGQPSAHQQSLVNSLDAPTPISKSALENFADALQCQRGRLQGVRSRLAAALGRALGDFAAAEDKPAPQAPGMVGIIGLEIDQFSAEIDQLIDLAGYLDRLA